MDQKGKKKKKKKDRSPQEVTKLLICFHLCLELQFITVWTFFFYLHHTSSQENTQMHGIILQ